MANRKMELKEARLDPTHKYAESNTFITAVYDRRLTAIGQKLIRIAIAEADSKHDTEFFAYRVRMTDLSDLLKLSADEKKNIYRNVKTACKYMATMAVGIEKEPINNNKTPSFKYLPMFRKLEYHDAEGWLEIMFNEEMTPFFLQLRKNFTEIPLWQILEMEHKYSVRIFELIRMKMFKSKSIEDGTVITPTGNELPLEHNVVELSIEEIRKATGTTNRYKQTRQLKDYVLTPAFRDIEESAGYHCTMHDIKEGRKVVGLRLDVYLKSAWNIMQMNKGQMDGQMNIFSFVQHD